MEYHYKDFCSVCPEVTKALILDQSINFNLDNQLVKVSLDTQTDPKVVKNKILSGGKSLKAPLMIMDRIAILSTLSFENHYNLIKQIRKGMEVKK